MPENTAPTATPNSQDNTASNDDGGATNDQPLLQDQGFEEPITAETPQEDVDKLITETLGDEFTTPETTEDKDKKDDDKPEDVKPEATADTKKDSENAEDTTKQTAEDENIKPTKGYKNADEEIKNQVDEAKKTVEDLANATVDTSDLWVEVKDADGNTVKIDVENGVPEDFKFANDKQLYDLLDAMQEMRNMKVERQTELTNQKIEAEGVAKAAENTQAQLESWDTEIEELINAGVLTAPTAKADSPEFNNDPTVQKVAAVFDYMAKENETRQSEGKPLLNSFGTALNLYDKQQAKAEEEAKLKAGNDEAKNAGSRVGGSSAASGGDQFVYKSGQYNNIFDIPV